ncbi:MAG: SAM-dependent chlorinase/fluorinase [Acidimicrobiales bacterium]
MTQLSPSLRFETISFLSDYGLEDEFVGVVKSVVRSIAPDVMVIDITHNIAPHDVRAGGLALARASQYLAPGVVIAVVDPGVGSARRAVALEVGDGQSILVGPDNGLLAPAVAMCGGATAAVALDNPEFHLVSADDSVGVTFAGRDIFAPVAAHLCLGVALRDLGTEIHVESLTPGLIPVARNEEAAIIAEVLWVDRYGNAQLNVDLSDIESLGSMLRVRAHDSVRRAVLAPTYAALSAGVVGLVVDSYGLLSLCVDRGSAAIDLRITAGDEVRIERVDDEQDTALASVDVPIALRKRGNAS